MSTFIFVAHDKHVGILASMVSADCIATVGDDLSGYSSRSWLQKAQSLTWLSSFLIHHSQGIFQLQCVCTKSWYLILLLLFILTSSKAAWSLGLLL